VAKYLTIGQVTSEIRRRKEERKKETPPAQHNGRRPAAAKKHPGAEQRCVPAAE